MVLDPVRARQDEAASVQAARMLGDGFMAHFDDPTVMEIYVNPDCRVRVDRSGSGRAPTSVVLQPSAVEQFLAYMAAHTGETLTPDKPTLSGPMPEARFARARLQGYIPPRAAGPGFNLRKHSTQVYPLESYVERGALSVDRYHLLIEAVEQQSNILIAGGTKSGKTTFLKAIIRAMSERFPHERFMFIEDTPELVCTGDDHVFLRTLPGESMAAPVKEVLRLAPDRVFCGEFRDVAAYHVADLWSTGHPGGAATTHADDVDGALERMNRLALDGRQGCYKYLISQAVNVVAVIGRTPVGGRVTDLAMVNGLDSSGRFILERPVAFGA